VPTPVRGGGETLLVAEDDPDVRTWVARALRELGYTVLEANNGAHALALLESQADLRPALLVADVVMPQMSGIALAEHLQATYPALPVLFISGYTTSAIAEQVGSGGSRAFLGKPFSHDALARQVRDLLDGVA
jgi:CheY-like chemotaxis protein